jgi:hypothetical protein
MQILEMLQLQRLWPDVSRRRMAGIASTTILGAFIGKSSAKSMLLSFRYGIVVLRCVALLPQAAL